ncbi:mitochondrial fission 1 protein A [Artemisia annua]|uniref:Mitochondrial fission 1 protein A n=1 Tax=Artemisia annua TaxID=35608 RepID=A0A2U1NDZ5_ARTAN|nr:mitochondrial fission 1 protein A [Artemisia annua]
MGKFACCSSEEQKDHAIRYPYAWALVHSRIPNDRYRGMDLLRGSVESTTSINPKQQKKEMYLLAVGSFRSQNYPKSRELVHRCLKIKPNCRKSLFLKEVMAYRDKKGKSIKTIVTCTSLSDYSNVHNMLEFIDEGKKSSIPVDPPVTSVEFMTSVLAATPCRSSHPTWGIEEVPSWTHPITSSKNKESTQQTIDQGSTKQGYDYLPWTDPETVLLWDYKFACYSSEEQKDAIRYPYAWVLIHSRKPDDMYRGMNMLKEGKKSGISVDPFITSVEFVTGILEANPRSSHPTWGIEKVPDWAHPITPKKKLPAPPPRISEEDLLCACLATFVATGFLFLGVLSLSNK